MILADGDPPSELLIHWRQILGAWLAFLVTAGATYHTIPVLLPQLAREFGATQYSISWLPALFQLFKGLLTLPGGYAAHYFGVVRCLRLGTIVITVASLCYPFARSLWLLGVLHAVQGGAYDFCGIATFIIFTSSWFERQRALAIGILVTAFSIAGVIFPPAVAMVAARFGWRAAAGICPVAMATVVAPLVFWVFRDGPMTGQQVPQQLPIAGKGGAGSSGAAGGCAAAGCIERAHLAAADEEAAVTARGPPAQSLSFAASLRLGAVWHLAFMSLYQQYIMIALLNTLFLYLREDVGMPLERCGFYSSTIFFTSMLGKLIAGAALDSRVGGAACVGSGLTLVLGTSLAFDFTTWRLTTSHAQLLLFAVVYGLGFGTSYGVTCSKPAKTFGGMPEFAKLQGFLMLFQVVGGFLGTLVTGRLRVATGSYGLPFGVFVALALIACLHALALEAGPCGARRRY
jgi:MFS family permease